jgi:myo-inositol-1(or 4)-monophosphatase
MPSPTFDVSASSESAYLARIDSALDAASRLIEATPSLAGTAKYKHDDHLVTDLDVTVSQLLREQLLQPGEGWLSEEDPDDRSRLARQVTWIIDPLDGTREFVDNIPEWSISVAVAVNGEPVAGGIVNPATGERFLGSLTTGVSYNGKPAAASGRTSLQGATVLASRQEYLRGEWDAFENLDLQVRPCGSVAYKLALVAAGLADATFTLQPKHEWDIAAGVALVRAAGGSVACPGNALLAFNRPNTLLPGLVASARGIWNDLARMLQLQPHKS